MLSEFTDLDLQKQVKALTKEVARLSKHATRRGAAFYSDAGDAVSDTYSDLTDFVVSNLPALRRRAKAFEKTAYDHPAAVAAVGLVVIGLVASLILSRRSPAQPEPVRKPRRRARSR